MNILGVLVLPGSPHQSIVDPIRFEPGTICRLLLSCGVVNMRSGNTVLHGVAQSVSLMRLAPSTAPQYAFTVALLILIVGAPRSMDSRMQQCQSKALFGGYKARVLDRGY